MALNPFGPGCLPLSYSGNPGATGVSGRGGAHGLVAEVDLHRSSADGAADVEAGHGETWAVAVIPQSVRSSRCTARYSTRLRGCSAVEFSLNNVRDRQCGRAHRR